MPKLKFTITNEAGNVTGDYTIDCSDRPGLDVDKYDTQYSINLIRSVAERHQYLSDFPQVPELWQASPSLPLGDALKATHLHNVNELWLEIQNLLAGARLNFATSRTLKQLEDGYNEASEFDVNAKFDLHLEKMERFLLAAFEMARIEDLVVRLLYEFFGNNFIEADASKEGWEKRLTWDVMKDSLNKRGQPSKQPHPAVEAMNVVDYDALMLLIRGYRSSEVVKLTNYRDIRTHRAAPSVDHPELAIDIVPVSRSMAGTPVQLSRKNEPAYTFLELYDDAKKVYSHLSAMLVGINKIIHA